MACLPLSPSLSSSSSSQCTPPPPPNAALPPPPPLLSQYHQKLHTFTLLAVWSQRHLTSALPLLLLLLLCPARPIGHTPNPHPAPVAPKQQQQQLDPQTSLAPRTLSSACCVLLSPTRPAASTSLTSPDRPSSHHSSPASSSQLSPLALLHAYCCARVLACVSVCGSTVRFTSATACLLACCLLCWSPPRRPPQ